MSKVMSRLSAKFAVMLAIVTALILIGLPSLPALSKASPSPDQPFLVATAPAAPTLVPAILGGRRVHVLYVTRTEDTVLIRCYPGYQPTITVRAMGSNPNADGQREGVMTCQPAA